VLFQVAYGEISSARPIPGDFVIETRFLHSFRIVVCVNATPRSAIISTRSRELSLNLRYQRTHSTMISRSKCRPLKRSGAIILAIIAVDSQRIQSLHQNLRKLVERHDALFLEKWNEYFTR
jgi:hypothetical protein